MLMPTVCKLLRADKSVSGKISFERVSAINKGGGWLPAANNSWADPRYRPAQRTGQEGEHARTGQQGEHGAEGGAGTEGVPSVLDKTSFVMSNGHVPDLEVSVLRLAAGGRLVPHVGSSNARLNVHLPLRVPAAGAGLRVGDQVGEDVTSTNLPRSRILVCLISI
jgi:hypothetical protein